MNLKKLRKKTNFVPDQNDLDWTKNMLNFISNSNLDSDTFYWSQTWFTLQFSKKNRVAQLIEVDFKTDTAECLSRTIIVLEKMGYKVKTADKLIANLPQLKIPRNYEPKLKKDFNMIMPKDMNRVEANDDEIYRYLPGRKLPRESLDIEQGTCLLYGDDDEPVVIFDKSQKEDTE